MVLEVIVFAFKLQFGCLETYGKWKMLESIDGYTYIGSQWSRIETRSVNLASSSFSMYPWSCCTVADHAVLLRVMLLMLIVIRACSRNSNASKLFVARPFPYKVGIKCSFEVGHLILFVSLV